MTGIIGSGFGLYGYLPAMVNLTHEEVCLLGKSYTLFKSRKELQYCNENIIWETDEAEFFKKIDTIILALPPAVQSEYIKKIIKHDNIKRVLLEKPISITPYKSSIILKKLKLYQKSIRIAYTFRYTKWGQLLIHLFAEGEFQTIEQMNIFWSFNAHHYKNDINIWKRCNSEGGGSIRFYGIHLIAFFSYLNYTEVQESITKGRSFDDYAEWDAIFLGVGLPKIRILVHSRSQTERFTITVRLKGSITNDTFISLSDPFSNEKFEKLDKRVKILEELITSFKNEDDDSLFLYYEKMIAIWTMIEARNKHEIF